MDWRKYVEAGRQLTQALNESFSADAIIEAIGRAPLEIAKAVVATTIRSRTRGDTRFRRRFHDWAWAQPELNSEQHGKISYSAIRPSDVHSCHLDTALARLGWAGQ